MVILIILSLLGVLLGGIAFVVKGADIGSPMTEYNIYGEQGEDEWTRHAMGMTEEEYKKFMG